MSEFFKKKPVKKVESKVETRFYDELFKRLQDGESDEFKDPENLNQKDIFYNNIIEQISENEDELKKCLNSFHIDYFIYKSGVASFVKLFELILRDDQKLSEYLGDRRISRAYEACLTCIGEKFSKPSSVNDSQVETAKACIKKLGAHLSANFQTIIDTENGVFSLRCFLRILGSPDVLEPANNASKQSNNKLKKKFNKEFNIRDVELKTLPEEWKLKKLLKKFKLEEISLEKGLLPSISPCISLFMRKLYSSYPKASSDLINKIHLQFVKKASSFHSMIQDSIGSRFIESFLLCCPTELLIDYYLEKHIIPNVTAYCKHTYANYSVQSLLKYRLQSEPKLSVLYDSVVNNLESIIDLHSDLIFKNYLMLELINACHKQPELLDFKNLVKVIMEYFGCEAEENRVNFLRILLSYEKLDDILKECPVDQALFSFDIKPIACTLAAKLIEYNDKTLIKCFNNLNSNELEHLCTNNVGSHFIQEVLKLYNLKERTENLSAFFEKLKGRLLIIATNRSGSFVMETLWSIANLKNRIAIAEELKVAEVQLKNDQYAKFLMHTIGLSFYKRKPEEWKQIQTNEFKKRKMFADMIDDTSSKKKLKINQ